MRPPRRVRERQPVRRLRWLLVPLTVVALLAGLATASAADQDPVPSEQDVADAAARAQGKAHDVDAIQGELAVANAELRESAISAGRAAEEYNGARWELRLARRAATAADERAHAAARDLSRQQAAYADALALSYQVAPQLQALSAIIQSDGIAAVVDQTNTLRNAESALDERYDTFRASSTLAEVAENQAAETRDEASAAAEAARKARNAARAAQAAAAANAAAVTARKDALIRELAQLEGISTSLAATRQAALEAAAAEAAAAAAQHEQQQSDSGAGAGAGTQPGPSEPSPTQPAPTEPTPTEPTPTGPTPSEPPTDPSPPAPSGGASSAIAFARAQLGEPYRWGAAGPDAWDCSGLTMRAWGAGGRSLPHYSVAQYQQSTPIRVSQLQPGDLVFWGSSSSPSSIYHVALYVGGGQIIHAPRTGRPVSLESMYYWIPPTFFARP